MEPQTPIQPTSTGVPETPAAPAAAPAPSGPAFVGNTNIVDRSVQSLYPAPTTPVPSTPAPFQPASLPADDQYAQASSAFNEAIVLITGLASSTAYLLLLYFVKNIWAIIIISFILAMVAVVFAILNYRKTKSVSPLTVIGLSAATYTIVTVASFAIAALLVNSAYSSITGY